MRNNIYNKEKLHIFRQFLEKIFYSVVYIKSHTQFIKWYHSWLFNICTTGQLPCEVSVNDINLGNKSHLLASSGLVLGPTYVKYVYRVVYVLDGSP